MTSDHRPPGGWQGRAAQVRTAVDTQIRNLLAACAPTPRVQQLLSYAASDPGKMLRPLLCGLAYSACGGTNELSAARAGAAIELVHTWTLVHDDIIDQSETRRGKPSVWHKHGTANALLAGDALIFLALESVTEAFRHDGAMTRLGDAIRMLSRFCNEMIEGEILDVELEKSSGGEEAYLRMLDGKTGALIAASVVLGGMLAGADYVTLGALVTYGRNLGVAFQLRDDVLDMVGDPALMGKARGTDIRNGKRTVLVLDLERKLTGSQLDRLRHLLDSKSAQADDIDWVAEEMRQAGSIDYVRDMTLKRASLSKEALSVFAPGESVDALRELVDYAVERTH
jgi:geranylgeranyl diphosphate synthase, type I